MNTRHLPAPDPTPSVHSASAYIDVELELAAPELVAAVEPADDHRLGEEEAGDGKRGEREQDLVERVHLDRAGAAEAQVLKLPDEQLKEPGQVAVGSNDKGLTVAAS